jgi:hypothetical protein
MGCVSGVSAVWGIPVRVISGLQDDKRYRGFGRVAQGKMRSLAPQASSKLGELSGKSKGRPATRLSNDLKVVPCDAMAQAGSNGLHSRLFGSKASRQTLGSIRLGSAVAYLFGGKNAVQEAVTKALYGSPDPGHLSQVNSCAYNHLRRSPKYHNRL